MSIPADLLAAWEHLAVAQESIDQAAHAPAAIEDRIMAVCNAVTAVLAVQHVVLRHVADRRNRPV